jgi:hypothetical protein
MPTPSDTETISKVVAEAFSKQPAEAAGILAELIATFHQAGKTDMVGNAIWELGRRVRDADDSEAATRWHLDVSTAITRLPSYLEAIKTLIEAIDVGVIERLGEGSFPFQKAE